MVHKGDIVILRRETLTEPWFDGELAEVVDSSPGQASELVVYSFYSGITFYVSANQWEKQPRRHQAQASV